MEQFFFKDVTDVDFDNVTLWKYLNNISQYLAKINVAFMASHDLQWSI